MPYVLTEVTTGRLLAGAQVNGYQLPYFGIILWDHVPDAPAVADALAHAGVDGSEMPGWQPVELTEHQAKMANVKLRNDARRQVFLRDEALEASWKE